MGCDENRGKSGVRLVVVCMYLASTHLIPFFQPVFGAGHPTRPHDGTISHLRLHHRYLRALIGLIDALPRPHPSDSERTASHIFLPPSRLAY
ncbi:hypothetical protein E2C01_031260 [Portunus trituberculatus]|uniref:Uncharacterized protein n=1 Tax=Portunus trituberculatus TaxID=210409 RepID=A0A5B7ESI2_PORTR|nr:hypothetical protein [Portunus trituberculatus]